MVDFEDGACLNEKTQVADCGPFAGGHVSHVNLLSILVFSGRATKTPTSVRQYVSTSVRQYVSSRRSIVTVKMLIAQDFKIWFHGLRRLASASPMDWLLSPSHGPRYTGITAPTLAIGSRGLRRLANTSLIDWRSRLRLKRLPWRKSRVLSPLAS